MKRTSRLERVEERLALLEKRCAQFNEKYPVGTLIRYFPVKGEPEFREGHTTTTARVLSGHTSVVWLDSESGCVCLDHCTPVQPHEFLAERLEPQVRGKEGASGEITTGAALETAPEAFPAGGAVWSALWRVGRQRDVVIDEGGRIVCNCLTAEGARRIVAAMNACLQIKSFLDRLEEGTAPDDPLRALRQQFHAPMHAALDEALESRV